MNWWHVPVLSLTYCDPIQVTSCLCLWEETGTEWRGLSGEKFYLLSPSWGIQLVSLGTLLEQSQLGDWATLTKAVLGTQMNIKA